MSDRAPRAGDRFPWLWLRLSPNGSAEDLSAKLDDTRFNLVVIGQPAPADGVPGPGELLRTVVIPSDSANDRELERVHIPQPSFYLVRPDGHVGLAGSRLDMVAATGYLSERLGLETTAGSRMQR